ncbi:MAG: PseG/SpsG family protein [Shimia sp.]
MSTPTVVMRCNASPTVGIGHLMRCREMARVLRTGGWDSVLLGPPRSMATPEDARLFRAWHPIAERGPDAQEARTIIETCAAYDTHHLILDDYRGTPPVQTALRAAGLRWLQQFDSSQRFEYDCDVLVNASPHERRAAYEHLLRRPEAQQTLFGPRYAVLRPDFLALDPRADGRPVARILVAFGGGDDRGAIAFTLEALRGIGTESEDGIDDGAVTLVAVVGASNGNAAQIKALASAAPDAPVEVHHAPPDLPALMAGCDLAVIAGGTMGYEAAICGLPPIFMALADNQHRSCMGWHALTGAPYLGRADAVAAADLRAAAAALITDHDRRRDIARAGRAEVDGYGAQRLIDALLGPSFQVPPGIRDDT